LPNKDILRNTIEIFRKTQADCLCRPQPLSPPDVNEFQMAVSYCRSSALGHKPGSEIYADFEGEVDPTSSGAMYTRKVFETIGKFNENFDACEDVEFNYRVRKAGFKAYLSPRLAVMYYPRTSIRGLWKQMFRYGRGRFRFARTHREYSLMQWLAGAATAAFIGMAFLSFIFPEIAKAFKDLVGIYILLAVFGSLFLAVRHKHLACLLYGPVIFPTIHFGLGCGFLREGLDYILRK